MYATLKYTEKLYLLEHFVLALSCLYFIDELHFGVLVDRIYFEQIRADSTMFLRPHLDHLQNILALMSTSIRQFLEIPVEFHPIGKTLLQQRIVVQSLFVLKDLQFALLAYDAVIIMQKREMVFGG